MNSPRNGRVRLERRKDIGVVVMDDGKLNCLNRPMRTELMRALEDMLADTELKAIVLAAGGRAWCAGADLNEMDSDEAEADPNLQLTITGWLDACPKPVVAAIHGPALGGGFELALACHYRVVHRSALLGLPEVKLGLFPGAGGTQRLPRAIGLERATNLILSGATRKAEVFEGTNLIDALVEDDTLNAAVDFADRLPSAAPPRLRDRAVDHANAEGYFAIVAAAVNANPARLPGQPAAVMSLLAAATKPFDQALAQEYAGFRSIRASLESLPYRHAFFAERKAAIVKGLDLAVKCRPVQSVAVIGAGTMGQGIALACAEAGYTVSFLDLNAAVLAAAQDQIRDYYSAQVERGRIDASRAAETQSRIVPAPDYDGISGADLVIEAVPEEMPIKQAVFERLDKVMKPGAILATNTSTLDVDLIAAFTKRPTDVLGLHFFNPANVMRLLEVVRGRATADDVLASALGFGRKLGKVNVVAGVCDGFIGNRMIEQYLKQAQFLVEEGASPQQVDRALERWGMAMGPFRMNDLAGNDVTGAIRERRRAEQPMSIHPSLPDLVGARGWLGQKTGLGWYDYGGNARKPRPNSDLAALLVQWREQAGIPPRAIADAEIIDRCVYALINEGAAVLAEGIAQRASDIDVVYLTGYGFPQRTGGPMYLADTIGITNIARRIGEFAKLKHGDPSFWTPHPLLCELSSGCRNLREYGNEND